MHPTERCPSLVAPPLNPSDIKERLVGVDPLPNLCIDVHRIRNATLHKVSSNSEATAVRCSMGASTPAWPSYPWEPVCRMQVSGGQTQSSSDHWSWGSWLLRSYNQHDLVPSTRVVDRKYQQFNTHQTQKLKVKLRFEGTSHGPTLGFWRPTEVMDVLRAFDISAGRLSATFCKRSSNWLIWPARESWNAFMAWKVATGRLAKTARTT